MAAVFSCQCDEEPDNTPNLGDGFGAATAVDATTVLVTFSEAIDAGSVNGAFAIQNFTVVPPEDVAVASTTLTRDVQVTLVTSRPLTAGSSYTVQVEGLRTTSGRTLAGSLNFVARGAAGQPGTVEITVVDLATARRHTGGLVAMATVAADGTFSESVVPWPMTDEGDRFVARLPAQVDPRRTVDGGDDGDPQVDRRPYGVILMDSRGRPASALVTFVVPDERLVVVPVTVLPPIELIDQPIEDVLPAPPTDENPGDGLKVVRLVVDDRAASELATPALRLSLAANGNFDAGFPQTLPLTRMTGVDAGYWQVVVQVRVDANRRSDGTTADTFPYFAVLVEDGVIYESVSSALVAPDETPQTVRLSLGRADWTPVTFRVDASRAYLNLSGSERGVRTGESVFVTGEWQQAVDAFGNNCGDAFSGGEQLCLRMRQVQNQPGVWQRTIWLPPGRPYGWKVVRCDTQTGCGPLNRLVASSGRAFATVMKNLATSNIDAFVDPSVGIVDVLNPAQTQAGGQVRDYTAATVYAGQGIGPEPNPAGVPDGQRMFKQEVPDLVVVVGRTPIRTPAFHVGTWRDVNLGVTPQEILAGQLSVALTPTDYDDGFIGRFPPSREEP